MSVIIRDMTDYEKELLADHVSRVELRAWCEQAKTDCILGAMHDAHKTGYTWALNEIIMTFCKGEK